MGFEVEAFGSEATPDLVLRTTANLDERAVQLTRAAIGEHVANGVGRRILVDHSGLDGVGWSSADARAIAQVLADLDAQLLPDTKIAVLAPAAVDFGSMRMVLTFIEIQHEQYPSGVSVHRQVFENLDAALHWLRAPGP